MIIDLSFLQAIFSFLIILTPIVFFHELGHFWVARRFGVNVEIFSIGFGPVLFSKTDNYGTAWQLAAIPIGGFVKMEGELNINPSRNKTLIKKGSFQFANVWQRSAIVFAGPFANVLLTIMIIASIYLFFGKVEIPNTINSIVSNSAAEKAGLLKNDRIVSINQKKVKTFDNIRQIVMESPDIELEIEIIRNKISKFFLVTPDSIWSEVLELNIGQLGVVSDQGYLKRYGLSESLFYSASDTLNISKSMFSGIKRLITGKFQKGEIGGPVRIAELSGRAFLSGWISLLFFGALISLNLGLVNLLPIPALDGGHLVLYFIEILFRKPLPEKIQNLLIKGGISFLLALMILITFFDISRYF